MSKPPRKAAAKKPAAKVDRRGARKGKTAGITGKNGGGSIGQAKFEPTQDQRDLVMMAAACAKPQYAIAAALGISEDTLQRHFRQELNGGVDLANAALGSVLYEEAKKGDVRAIETWFDRRGGANWKKKTGLEHTGANGGPIEYRDLSDDEINARLDSLLGRHDPTTAVTKH